MAASRRPTSYADLLPLLKTLLDITLMRKGPEHIPRSGLMLAMASVLWLVSALAAVALVEQMSEAVFFSNLLNKLIGVTCFAAVVALSGRSSRMLQTISALIGIGAIVTFVFVAEYLILKPLLGPRTALTIGTLILLWSVPVKGNIIARAIDSHWYVGLVIAVLVFSLQYAISLLMAPQAS